MPRRLTPKVTPRSKSFVKDISKLDKEIKFQVSEKSIVPLTQTQAQYINSMDVNTLTFGVGPAGTGKSYIAAAKAAEALINDDVERIILTRPAIEAGAKMGYLPGNMDEKFCPYVAPFRCELEKRLGSGAVEMFLKNKKILALPLAYIRGWTFENAFVILDEAQNTTPVEMKMLLTRIGEGSKVVVDGDLQQQDTFGLSGLADALNKLSCMNHVGAIYFDRNDIVRSGFVQEVVSRYES